MAIASSALRREAGTLNTAPSASRARHRQPPRVVAEPRVVGLLIVVPSVVRRLELSEGEAGAIGRVVRRPESLHPIRARLRPRREPARLGQHIAPNDARRVQRDPQPARVRPHDGAEERAWSRRQVPLAQVPEVLLDVVTLRDEPVPDVEALEVRALPRAERRVGRWRWWWWTVAGRSDRKSSPLPVVT